MRLGLFLQALKLSQHNNYRAHGFIILFQ